MPLSVESVPPVWGFVIISHMFAFAVDTFKSIRTWFALFSFQSRRICFEVSLATRCYVSVVFDFVGPTTFLTFQAMSFAQKGKMVL